MENDKRCSETAPQQSFLNAMQAYFRAGEIDTALIVTYAAALECQGVM